MDISTLLTLVSPEKAKWLRLKHPRAYLQNRRGMRSGIIRYDNWFLVDPDASVVDLSEAKTPEEAFDRAYRREIGFEASMTLGECHAERA